MFNQQQHNCNLIPLYSKNELVIIRKVLAHCKFDMKHMSLENPKNRSRIQLNKSNKVA